MSLSLAIKTDEERLKKLRDELRTLEKERSAIFSEVSSQRVALGEIGRDMEESIAKAQSARDALSFVNREILLVSKIIESNRAEAERQGIIVKEREAKAKSLELIDKRIQSKQEELEALNRSLFQEKSSLLSITREKEDTEKEISRKVLALESRENSILKRETEANSLESSLNAYQHRLTEERKDFELKKRRLSDYAETIGIKITFSTDDGTVEK